MVVVRSIPLVFCLMTEIAALMGGLLCSWSSWQSLLMEGCRAARRTVLVCDAQAGRVILAVWYVFSVTVTVRATVVVEKTVLVRRTGVVL